MTGNFLITYDYLKSLGACVAGLLDFKREYPEGGEYQAVLDACCARGHSDYAQWLLGKIGRTEDVREYKEKINNLSLEIVFAGRIVFKFNAVLKRLIAGWGIEAGGGIEAGEGIEAGWGFGVFAGLRIKISRWKTEARVIAKTKPANLISGYWVGDDSNAEDKSNE